jgi:hypothetical protein
LQTVLPDGLILFLQNLVSAFNISPSQTRFGVVQFSSTASFQFGFTQYYDAASLILNLGNLRPTGQHRSYVSALNVTVSELFAGARGDAQKVIVFLTDGSPDVDVNSTEALASIVKQSATVLVVGVTGNVCRRNTFDSIRRKLVSAFLILFFSS